MAVRRVVRFRRNVKSRRGRIYRAGLRQECSARAVVTGPSASINGYPGRRLKRVDNRGLDSANRQVLSAQLIVERRADQAGIDQNGVHAWAYIDVIWSIARPDLWP